MAKSNSVWGVDIGNASLKAVRCRPGDADGQVVAEAFDYIEYPKILTQPGAEPAELVAEALKQFQSRNNLRGDRVAISVSGQSGLARFIKLPPVESKRIPDIVQYEARQQIPFDLNDVIWDYQRMGGGMEEEGFVLEAEVGLFAIKRDQVFRALEPFRAAGVEVDFVQLTPLALYNFLVFDQLHDLPPVEDYDPEDPPPSYIILSMGTDATDLVVTNGYRVWQRSVPIGGNHFTRALTKELKETFAKAEHIKRNAASAKNPKAVYQAMRPVFNDLLTEIQRSITYFTSVDRAAVIGKIVPLGNAMKLPGLRRFLSQNLGYDVLKLDAFHALTGPEVVNAPAFKENLLAFGPSYGLALQALELGSLRTNLLPAEIVKDRLLRQKKPWVVAAAAVLLLSFTLGLAGLSRALGTVAENRFAEPVQAASSAVSESSTLKQAQSSAEAAFSETDNIGMNLVGNVEGRIQWLELLKAVLACLPSDPPGEEPPKEIWLRNQLHLTSLRCDKVENLQDWYTAVYEKYGRETSPGAEAGAEASDEAAAASPSGPGYVITLQGHHFHNSDTPELGGALFVQGAQFVRETLIRSLESESVILPRAGGQDEEESLESISLKELGIGFPVLYNPGQPRPAKIPNPNARGAQGMGGGYGGMEETMGYMGDAGMPGMESPGMATGFGRRTRTPGAKTDKEEEEPLAFDVKRFDFIVQFVWQPALPTERQEDEAAGEAEQAEPAGDDLT